MHPIALRRTRLAGGTLLLLLLALVGTGCGGSSDAGSDAATTTSAPTTTTAAEAPAAGAPTEGASTTVAGSTEVVKDILGTEVDPPGADGRTLTLIRYTIPPGTKLVPHIHPGVQMARITSGELTYTVVEGTAIVRRKGASADAELKAPVTTKLVPGDTVTELDGMVHFGANEGDVPVVIDATLLTVDGEDLAVPVTTTTP